METRTRSIVKAALWTLIGFVMMTSVGFVLTGSVSLGGQMATLNAGLGMVCYVIYERIWAAVSWGRDGG